MADTDGNQALKIISNDEIELAKADNFSNLEPKRRAFALRYILDYNHRKAAEEVGFSADYGITLLREPMIAAMISYLQEETQIANIITTDFVKTQFLNIIPMLAGEVEVPHVLPDGQEKDVKKFFPGELVNVLKELAKSTKFYEDGSGGGGNVNVIIDVGKLLGENVSQGITVEGDVE